MTAAVSLYKVSRAYGGAPVLDGLDLEVEAGSIVALLGPSGSGRSTCLRLIAGVEKPGSGTVRVFGEPAPGRSHRMHVLPQAHGLAEGLTVRRAVALPLKRVKLDRVVRQGRVAVALEAVGLPEFGERRVGTLSGGERQRVAVAAAIAGEADLLVCDEPLIGLDAGMRERLHGALKSMQRRIGSTMIFATQDQDLALSLADRVAVFEAGKIVQTGTPEDICRRPASRFVADFVGRSNVLPPDLVQGFMGQRQWASLRPEAVHVMRAGQGASRMTGIVVSRHYLGGFIRVGVDLGSIVLHALVPATDEVPQEGERATLGFPKDALYLMGGS